MRNELQHIEQIEQYLTKQMNAAEQAAFEKQMQNNPALAKQVKTQELLMQAAIRKAIKADIAKFGTASGGFNWMKWLGITTGIIIVAVISYFAIPSNKPTDSEKTGEAQVESTPQQTTIAEASDTTSNSKVKDPINQTDTISATNEHVTSDSSQKENSHTDKKYTYAEDTECGGLKTWIEPDRQFTKINPKNGTTIEGKEGTLIIVPSDAFVYDDGTLVTEEVKLELVEALNVSDMVAYNLTTINDDNALQSGGMIYVQPTVNGKEVNINPERPLYIEIPADNYNPEMKAWNGEVDQNGDINWKSPKELEKYLTTVDFDLLDFLPKGFEEAVEAGMPFKSYKEADKQLVDSLYYSLGVKNVFDSKLPDETATETTIAPMNKGGELGFLLSRKYLKGKSTLVGNVQDVYGGRIPNAQVYVFQNGLTNKKEIVTDNKGYFTFNKLEAGPFNLLVTAKGYEPKYSDQFTAGKKEQFTIESPIRLKPAPDNLSKTNNAVLNNSPSKGNEEVISNNELASSTPNCHISPQSIQTIKSDQFANTFLATKEFEQRIKILHQMPNAQQLFDLYVNNLDKNLWEVDEMVAAELNGANQQFFTDFASEKLTNVKDANIYQDQLTAYYTKKKEEYLTAAKKAQEAYRQKSTAELKKYKNDLAQLKAEYNSLNSANLTASPTVSQSKGAKFNLPKLNLPVSSKKLPKNNVVTSPNAYATKWYSSGWMNIDAYLHELSKGSKTVTIESKEKNGKIYQCLNTLKTVIPLTIAGIIAKAKFPKQGSPSATKMRNTFAIGVKRENGQLKYAEKFYNPYQTSSISLSWDPVSPEELKEKLKQLDGTAPLLKGIEQQEAYIQKQLEINQKKAVLKKEMNLVEEKIDGIEAELEKERMFIASLESVIDKCGVDFPINASVNNEAEVLEIVEQQPEFPGGQQAMFLFLSENIVYPQEAIDNGVQGTVYIQFTVDEQGNIIQPTVIKSLHPMMDEEALRVVRLMPNWNPPKNSGKPVSTKYTLPINFTLE